MMSKDFDIHYAAYEKGYAHGYEMGLSKGRAVAREECAKIADAFSNPYLGGSRGIAQEQGKAIANAIRSKDFNPEVMR